MLSLYEGITINKVNSTWHYSIEKDEDTNQYSVYEKQLTMDSLAFDTYEERTLIGTFVYKGHAELLIYGLQKLLEENEK